VRQRLGSHLLNLASRGPDGRLVVASLTNQELANAVGTAREVASRALGELSRMGLLETTKQGIVILDPDRLLSEVRAQVSA
jgi:CRP/FNR family transcriptional regulator